MTCISGPLDSPCFGRLTGHIEAQVSWPMTSYDGSIDLDTLVELLQ